MAPCSFPCFLLDLLPKVVIQGGRFVGLISMLGMGGGYFMFGLVMLLSIVLGFFQSVIIGHVSVTEQFSAAFRFGEWWRILRSNIGEFLLAFVFIMGIIHIVFYYLPVLFADHRTHLLAALPAFRGISIHDDSNCPALWAGLSRFAGENGSIEFLLLLPSRLKRGGFFLARRPYMPILVIIGSTLWVLHEKPADQ